MSDYNNPNKSHCRCGACCNSYECTCGMTPRGDAEAQDCCEVCKPDPCLEQCVPVCNPCAGFDPCDKLTLIQYKILFTKRGLEVVFYEREELVAGFFGPDQFATWKVAEFITKLGVTPMPDLWRAVCYPHACPEPPEICTINFIPPEDQKYLQVYCKVQAEYPRERLKYEEEQLALLSQIRDAIAGGQPVVS